MGEGLKVDDSELKAEIEKIRQDVRNTNMTGEQRYREQKDINATQAKKLAIVSRQTAIVRD